MVAWRYEISLRVFFSTLEEKIRISARVCNILYIRMVHINKNIPYTPFTQVDAFFYQKRQMVEETEG